MTADVVAIPPTTTLKKAANMMRGRSIGCLVVTRDGRPVGIVTTADLLELIGRGLDRQAAHPARPTLSHRVPHRKNRAAATGVW
jgi:CBS domain-containing protein